MLLGVPERKKMVRRWRKRTGGGVDDDDDDQDEGADQDDEEDHDWQRQPRDKDGIKTMQTETGRDGEGCDEGRERR